MLEKLRSFSNWLVLQMKLARLAWIEARLRTNLTAATDGNPADGIHDQVSPEDARQAFQDILSMLMADALRRNRGEFDLDAIGFADREYVELLSRGRVIEKLNQPISLDALKVFLLDYGKAFGRATAIAVLKIRACKTEGVNHHGQLLH